MHEKLLAMIVKLSERTSEGKVEWEQTVDEGVFQAAFPSYSVQISQRPNREEHGIFDIVLRIFNEQGVIIEEVSDPDLSSARRDAFRIMRTIYDGARAKAMGLDTAVDTILSELTKDDIPF